MAEWNPEPRFEAFPGVLNGGIIGTLLDCHCNWTAAWHLMNKAGERHPPCTVTANYSIKLLRPTPTDVPVFLSATIVEIETNAHPAWRVFSQSLAAYSLVPAGTNVIVRLARPSGGGTTTIVPDLSGRTSAEATTLLASAGLSAGLIDGHS